MADANDLTGLTFATVRRSIRLNRVCLCESGEGFPERDGDGSVVRIFYSFCDLSVLDQFSILAPELKFSAVVIN